VSNNTPRKGPRKGRRKAPLTSGTGRDTNIGKLHVPRAHHSILRCPRKTLYLEGNGIRKDPSNTVKHTYSEKRLSVSSEKPAEEPTKKKFLSKKVCKEELFVRAKFSPAEPRNNKYRTPAPRRSKDKKSRLPKKKVRKEPGSSSVPTRNLNSRTKRTKMSHVETHSPSNPKNCPSTRKGLGKRPDPKAWLLYPKNAYYAIKFCRPSQVSAGGAGS
jgi:hypothetical protein